MLLKQTDGIGALQREVDVIVAIEQAQLAKRIHFKTNGFTIVENNMLLFQINVEFEGILGIQSAEQIIDRFFVQGYWQNTVLKTIIEKIVVKSIKVISGYFFTFDQIINKSYL